MTPEQLFTHASIAKREIQRRKAESSLLEYSKLMWPLVDPGRPFIVGWAIEAMCAHLEAVTSGEIRRLLINVPPGFWKSGACCIYWPSWEWGPRNKAMHRFIFTSYVSSLTVANNLKLRRLIESAEYQELWGDRVQVTGDQAAKTYFENEQTGFAMASAVRVGVMGKRGDRIVVDDPNNTKEIDSEAKLNATLQWFTEVLPTRVNDEKTFSQVVIMQRVGERDISGHILAHELGYEHLCIPMEWRSKHPYIRYADKPTAIGWADPRTEEGELAFPERFGREGLEQLKKEMRAWGGIYAEAGQLDQLPVPRGGGLFQREWFTKNIIDRAPEGGRTVRAWDLAASLDAQSPYTAGVKIKRVGDCFYVLDVVAERVDPHGLDELIQATAASDGFAVEIDMPQDPGSAGKAQKAHLAAKLNGYTFRFSPETGKKDERAAPFAAQAGAGNVYVVRAPWNDPYIAELCMFPAGRYKDRVDASSRAYAALISQAAQESLHGGYGGTADD